MTNDISSRRWSSQFVFLSAAIGSAVGISNIWKFTYVAGENGGGAFVLIYILALAVIAIPALIAELLIGRRGGKSVVTTMQVLADEEGISRHWRYYGLMAAGGVFLALSFYCVIAGWTLDYFVSSLSGQLSAVSKQGAQQAFDTMQASPLRIIAYQIIFIAITAGVVAMGIKGGLERVLSYLTPGLFVLLIVLVIYAVIAGDFAAGFRFMFQADFSKVTWQVVLMAVGQAFFSLGVGLGVLMTIGAYSKQSYPLAKSALLIASADGLVAILAGLAIFPIVFAYGLSPAGGPGLIFTTLPIAFAQMPGGIIFGSLFFLLMAMAALTSSITLFETVIAWLEESCSLSRKTLSFITAVVLWLLGLGTVFSFNIWSDVSPLGMIPALQGKTFFALLDYLVSNILMPAGGISVAVLAGWCLSRETVAKQLNLGSSTLFSLWYGLVRYLVPISVTALFVVNLVSE